MSENWFGVADEVAEALASIADTDQLDSNLGHILRDGEATGPSYDPGALGPGTEHECRVLFDTFSSDEIDGTLILAKDLKVIASHMDIEPTPADRLRVGADEYEITMVWPVKPGGVVLMWELACRGS